jgi:hypothetical protein
LQRCSLLSSAAILMHCASSPESVVADWPSVAWGCATSTEPCGSVRSLLRTESPVISSVPQLPDPPNHSTAPHLTAPCPACATLHAPARAGPRPAAPSRTAGPPRGRTRSPPSTAVASPRPPRSTPFVKHHLETFLVDAAEADPHGEGVRAGSSPTSAPICTAASWPTASPASTATPAPSTASVPPSPPLPRPRRRPRRPLRGGDGAAVRITALKAIGCTRS